MVLFLFSVMPRNYCHKKRGKTLNYSTESLAQALDTTKNGLYVRKAAKMYDVPKSTLADRVCGRFGLDVAHGRPTAIPPEVERKIVKCVKVAAERGIGLTRRQLLQRVNLLSKRNQVSNVVCFSFHFSFHVHTYCLSPVPLALLQ